jgi:hypothetical protein
MSGFDFPIRRIDEGRKSGLKKRRQADLAFKSNEIRKRRSRMVNLANVDTFLPLIEKPQGLIMRLTYYFTRLQFGKALTPLKAHSARLPLAFGLFYSKIGKLDKKLMEWKKRKALLAGLLFGLAASATLSHAQLPPSRVVNEPGRVSGGEKGGSRG